MAAGSPRGIAEHASFRDAVSLLLPQERMDAFRAGTGVDLARVESALVAGFDLGTLYVWTPAPGSIPAIIERFRSRLVGGEQHHRPHPRIDRFAGVVAATPEALLTVDERLVAVAVADPHLARIVEAFAREKLRSSAPALKGAALATLPPAATDSLVTFYAAGPFSKEWERGAHGLLAAALGVSISVSPRANGRAHCAVQLSGDFPSGSADELAAAFRELTQSSLGELLALPEASENLRVAARDNVLTLDVDVALAPIAKGLRSTVSLDLQEILQIPRTR